MIVSNQPIPWDVAALRLRINQAELQHHFALAGIDLPGLLAPFLAPEVPVRVFGPADDRAKLKELNTDVFPRDEFSLPAFGP